MVGCPVLNIDLSGYLIKTGKLWHPQDACQYLNFFMDLIIVQCSMDKVANLCQIVLVSSRTMVVPFMSGLSLLDIN